MLCAAAGASDVKPDPEIQTDKWALLALLTHAAEDYELSHRTLGVLRALLTFLPQRLIPTRHLEAVVFPSNKTLANRMNGMPESTLRRHLAQLVKSGIVSRHDSANRKRFARRTAGQGRIGFGFDLSPLARLAQRLEQQAQARQDAQQEHAQLRVQLGHLRQQLIGAGGCDTLCDTAFRALRRKNNTDDLTQLCAQIEIALTEKMNGSDSQNERHIHKEFISNSVPVETELNRPQSQQETTLEAVVEQCKEYQCYFPAPARDWNDVVNIADRLVPMIGIDRPVFEEAISTMGLRRAATVVLCLLDRLPDIQNPGGYLRRLTQHARAGRLSLDRLASLSTRGGRGIVS